MTRDPIRNEQSGVPVAQSTNDAAAVASADRRDGKHYEADPDQIVKVVHQVKPRGIPVEGPTDFARHGGPQDTSVTDVAITPEVASVWEARKSDPGET
jgi:hypothetical protein